MEEDGKSEVSGATTFAVILVGVIGIVTMTWIGAADVARKEKAEEEKAAAAAEAAAKEAAFQQQMREIRELAEKVYDEEIARMLKEEKECEKRGKKCPKLSEIQRIELAGGAEAVEKYLYSAWITTQTEDGLTSKPIVFIKTKSKRPERKATLTLRRHPRLGKSVYLDVETGAIDCSPVVPCKIAVRFGDSKKIRKFSALLPSDGSVDTLFIREHAQFVSAVRKVDEVVIEMPFYQEGFRVFTFDVAGLRWH
jgi:hypothetical protein